jgi:DNA primase
VAGKYQIGFEQLRSLVRSEGTRGGIARERRPLKSGIHENKKKEDGMKQSQRLLLTWLIEDPRLFDATEKYIGPDDFTEEIYHQAAQILYDQHKQGEINPARIISMFTDEEQQREIAALFHARIHPVESRMEKEKALKETIIRVKRNSMEYRSHHLDPTDILGLQTLIEDRKQLADLQKLHISID